MREIGHPTPVNRVFLSKLGKLTVLLAEDEDATTWFELETCKVRKALPLKTLMTWGWREWSEAEEREWKVIKEAASRWGGSRR